MVNTLELEEGDPLNEDRESIKLIKNTKGYGWEVKLKEDLLSEATLERLKDINDKLIEYSNKCKGVSESESE